MAIPFPPIPAGTRVKIKHGGRPLDGSLIGRTGIVVEASDYRPVRLGVVPDGESPPRWFAPGDLEGTAAVPLLPPEREAAQLLRGIPRADGPGPAATPLAEGRNARTTNGW